MIPKQRIIFLAIGISCALAALYSLNLYLAQQRKIISAQEASRIASMEASQVTVLLAKKDIPKGSLIASADVESNEIPKEYKQPQAVSSYERIAGMISIAPIMKGEQITTSKLAQQKTSSSLADFTPVGKRAITISVDNISGLIGMIKPGNYVDVISVIPVPTQGADGKVTAQAAVLPLFQNVLVLAVGEDTGGGSENRYKKEDRGASPLITLALGPREANILAFVQEQGKIRLVLRSPADSNVQPIQPANWETVFQYIMPDSAPKKDNAPVERKPQPIGYVEVYKGLTKETVPLYKK